MHIFFSRIYIFSLMLFCIAASIFLIGTQPAFAQIDSRLKADGWRNSPLMTRNRIFLSGLVRILSRYKPIVQFRLPICLLMVRRWICGKHLRWRLNGNMKVRLSTRMYRKKAGMIVSLLFIWPFHISQNMPALKKKLMRPLVVASQGREAPGRLLTYIWAGAPEVGRWFENPYTGKAGYMQVIQEANDASNNPDIWRQHKVNIAEDFKDRFGYFPPNPAYVAIGVDSDDTNTTAITRVRGLGFIK